jgi:hypothetical protein
MDRGCGLLAPLPSLWFWRVGDLEPASKLLIQAISFLRAVPWMLLLPAALQEAVARAQALS